MMKIFQYSLIVAGLFTAYFCSAQSADWEWAISVNGPSDEDEIDAVASDKEGNVYISGKFEDTLQVSGYPTPLISNGMADIMLVKYDSTGVFQWAHQYGAAGEDNVFDAACTRNGDIIISGYFQNTIQIDTITIRSYGGFDAFLARLDSDGNVIWILQYGGTSDEGGNEVAITDKGQIIVSAKSLGNITIGTFNFTNPNPGIGDSYVISLNPDGTVAWARTISGIGASRAKAIAVDKAGNVYCGGDFISINYIVDELGIQHGLSSHGARDAYISSWTATGNLRWFKTWGGMGNEMCKGIATTEKLDVYLTGPFTETVNFDGKTFVSGGSSDFYMWKLSTTGGTEWLRHISSVEDVLSGGEIVSDGNGGVIMGIGLTNTLQLQTDTGFISYTVPIPGIAHPFFMQYNADGAITFTKFADDNSSGYGTFGEISRSGKRVFLDVILRGSLTFNNTISSGNYTNKDAGLTCIVLPDSEPNKINDIGINSKVLKIYPNPTRQFLNIQYREGTYDVFIYDMLGRMVYNQLKVKSKCIIDCSFLSDATYLLKVIDKNASYTGLFVKH